MAEKFGAPNKLKCKVHLSEKWWMHFLYPSLKDRTSDYLNCQEAAGCLSSDIHFVFFAVNLFSVAGDLYLGVL